MIRSLCTFAIAIAVFAPTALAADIRLNELTVRQWVQHNDGVVRGQLLIPREKGAVEAVSNASVAIADSDGNVIRSKTVTDEQGNFEIENLKPGVYALTARADFVFACCALHVVDPEIAAKAHISDIAEVTAANIDYTAVNRAIIRYLPANVRTDVMFDVEGLASLSDQPDNEMNTFRIAQTDGGLSGQLYRAGLENARLDGCLMTNVFIMRDGEEAARTVTDGSGQFRVDNLDAGTYSVMAVGPDGLGLVGFELIDETEIKTAKVATANGERLVTQYQDGCCCEQIALQVAPCPQVTSCFEQVVVEEPLCCEEEIIAEVPVETTIDPGFGYMPGYGGGGYYGGGGGGGYAGGAGLGGIAGLAGLGAAISVATSDDDGALAPAVPSPAVP